MVRCEDLDAYFHRLGIEFFTGVPDNCFKPWVNYITSTRNRDHIISTNEGEALSIAAGYHLATGKVAGVYLQNSGLGNLINPLTSIIDEYVYKIPVLLMISWRGKPGKPDEPQHKRMGENTTHFLEAMGIKYQIYDDNDLEHIILGEMNELVCAGHPYALLFEKGDIESSAKYETQPHAEESITESELTRWDALVQIAQFFPKDVVFFSTTGMTSRELYAWRDMTGGDHSRDFLNVGGMGWVSSLAFGFSLRSDKRVVIFDGDGSLLMHMGSMATIGHYMPRNITHVVFDNGSHDTVGGLPTVSATVDFARVAAAVGYQNSATVSSQQELREELMKLSASKQPSLLSVRVRKGARSGTPRPTLSPLERKNLFVDKLATRSNKF